MPNEIREIKQEHSYVAPKTNENEDTTGTMPRSEFNKLKRKLQEMEPELADCKHRLEDAELKAEEEQKKMKQLKALLGTGIKFEPKRDRITLTLPNFAKFAMQNKKAGFEVFSDPPVELAGFQWKLCMYRKAKDAWMGCCLVFAPSNNYQGEFDLEVNSSFRLFNTFPSSDMKKEENDRVTRKHNIVGVWKFVEMKTLLDAKNGFLQSDGSIRVEADFTVTIMGDTLQHFLAEYLGGDEGSSTA